MRRMRTTLTLDPDVARLLDAAVRRSSKSFKDIVNEALRRGLGTATETTRRKRFRVKPHRTKLVPGVDRGHLNALADELEDLAVVGKNGRRRPS